MENKEPQNVPLDTFKPMTGRDFIDQLILIIIDAHRNPKLSEFRWSKQRESRLRAARAALLDLKEVSGNQPIDDEKALLFMAREHRRDISLAEQMREGYPKSRAGNKPRIRSVRQLAQVAAKLTTGQNKSAIVDRLRKAFEKTDGSEHPRKRKESLLFIEDHNDYVAETLQHHDLVAISIALQRNGVSTKISNRI